MMDRALSLDALADARGDSDAPSLSRWLGAEGARTRYLQAGEGSPVVLIHGAMSTADDVAGALFRSLKETHAVYALDRPGHGWSDRTRWDQASIQSQALTMLAAIRDLGLERPILVGHSYGGSCAVAMALAAPEQVKGVVAISPAAFPEPRLEQVLFGPRATLTAGDLYSSTAGRFTDPAVLHLLWEAMFTPRRMPDEFRRLFPFARARGPAQVIATGEDAAAMSLSLAQNFAGYSRCAVPVRVLVGSGDIVTSNMHGRTLAAAVPDGRLDRLPGLGHMLHWFAPERVADAVAELAA